MTDTELRDAGGVPCSARDAVVSWLDVANDMRRENGDELDENELWALRDLADCVGELLRRPDEPQCVVIVVRDPDASNDYHEYFTPPNGLYITDVDCGYADLKDRAEFMDWACERLDDARRLRTAVPNHPAADKLEEIVLSYMHEDFEDLDQLEAALTEANLL